MSCLKNLTKEEEYGRDRVRAVMPTLPMAALRSGLVYAAEYMRQWRRKVYPLNDASDAVMIDLMSRHGNERVFRASIIAIECYAEEIRSRRRLSLRMNRSIN